MGTTRSVQPVTSCAFCGGPMPPPSATGRPAVFCSGACRKAAHEARRTGARGAFEVKVVDRVVVESHDLAGCVARVIASPAASRRVLQALTALADDGTLGTDPKWRPTQDAATSLVAAVSAPPSRLPYRRY
jgi:hypothetical protein